MFGGLLLLITFGDASGGLWPIKIKVWFAYSHIKFAVIVQEMIYLHLI